MRGRREAQQAWSLEAFGARVGLVGAVDPLPAAVAAALPGSAVTPLDGRPGLRRSDVLYRFSPLAGGQLRLTRGGREIGRGSPQAVLRRVVDSLHFEIALHARQASFLHASVVRWAGRLLVFPGRTGSGKSTLAACLVERGATYFSDEYAPIDDEGRVIPYPKPISLRPAVSARYAGDGGDGARDPAPADAVVLTRFRPGGRFQPRPLSVESAALALVDNSVVATPRPRQAAAAVARLLAHRPRLVQGPRGEAEDFVAELERWLAGGS